MNQTDYVKWIAENYQGGGPGQCSEASSRMVAAFPELARVRGHYYCVIWGEREHWWCKTSEGLVVDPTAGQFPSKGHGEYVEWDEGSPEPIGMCIDCGSYVYEDGYSTNFCSRACERATLNYLSCGF